VVLGTAACDVDVVRPTTIPVGTVVHETFTGTLAKDSFAFYSFTAPRYGLVEVRLLELREGGQPSTALMGLSLGVPRQTGCQPTATLNVQADPVAAHIAGLQDANVYCAQLADIGNLAGTATFVVSITRPQ
jgi:hypothetical protein